MLANKSVYMMFIRRVKPNYQIVFERLLEKPQILKNQATLI